MPRREVLGLLVVFPVVILVFALGVRWVLAQYFQSVFVEIADGYFFIVGALIVLGELYVLFAEHD